LLVAKIEEHGTSVAGCDPSQPANERLTLSALFEWSAQGTSAREEFS